MHYDPCEGGITLHAAWVEGLIRLGTEESITVALVVFETMQIVWGNVDTTPLKRLSSIHRPAAAEVLLRYGLTSNNIDVAQYSARALGQIGYEQAVSALLAWAEEQFHVVQEILRDWPAPMVAPQTRTGVLAAISAREEPVMHAALLCFQHFDPVLVTPGILEEVERLIVDEETGTGLWYAAIEVLSTLDDHRTVSLLYTILTCSRPPRNCRIRLVRTLAVIGDPAAIPVILETASDERRSRLRLRRLYRARAQYLSAWLTLADAYAEIRNAVFYRYRYRGSGDVLHIREDGRVAVANGQTMPAWRAEQRLCRLESELGI